MGAAALVLADNELAIHGTNNPGSIGRFVSWGCVRMNNQDIIDLYDRVSVSTRVVFSDPPRVEIAKPAVAAKPAASSIVQTNAPTDGVPAALPDVSESQAPLPSHFDIFD